LLCLLAVSAIVHTSPLKKPRHYDIREEDMYRIRYLPYLDKDGKVQYEDLMNVVSPSTRASVSDVNFYFYTQSNPESPVIISSNDVNVLASTNYDSSKKNVFISHGWNNNYESDVNVYIRQSLLQVQDVNLFIVDWSGLANGLYLTGYWNVEDVGSIVGDYISSMIDTYGLSTSDFYLIGHSLGAHIAGCAGARVKFLRGSLVYSIVGLDPAGPLFTIGNTDNRIDSSDGDFVHIIHTNTALLGFSSSIGDADYFPNGGSSQNGCGIDLVGTCAHGRSYIYYAESLLTSGFVSTGCSSYSTYNDGGCSGNSQSLMGQYNVDKSASGDYYLNTNSDSLYALG
jgi:pancreatic triacylglycerol lipase